MRHLDDIHRRLIAKYHVLAKQLSMTDEDKQAVLAQFGVESSKDLNEHQLIDLCASLAREVEKRFGKDNMDVLRKRVIVAITGYLKANKQQHDIAYVKGVACRVAKCNSFNKISREKLRSIYGTFVMKKRVLDEADAYCAEVRQRRRNAV